MLILFLRYEYRDSRGFFLRGIGNSNNKQKCNRQWNNLEDVKYRPTNNLHQKQGCEAFDSR